MNTFSHVPPGFRFHPTDEELVDYYLRKKISARRIDLDVIKDVDLYKIEPWDLQELCRIGTEEQSDWYFFSHKDKKYPTGTRTNRATAAGFWKATGRDKAIYAKHDLIGMRKTLVFYKGRAPNGQKSDWIMHEYRLENDENGAPQEEGWVVCRVFKKKLPSMRRMSEQESPCWYEEQVSFMPADMDSPNQNSSMNNHQMMQQVSYHHGYFPNYPCKKELDHHQHHHLPLFHQHNNHVVNIPNNNEHFFQLPLLQSSPAAAAVSSSSAMTSAAAAAYSIDINQNFHHHQAVTSSYGGNNSNEDHHLQGVDDDQLTDWRVLDKFVASQLSQDDASKGNSYS